MAHAPQQSRDKHPIITAIGLMSGTSMDGIDAALIETDGQSIERFGEVVHTSYEEAFRARLRSLLGCKPDDSSETADVIKQLTKRHADAVQQLLQKSGLKPADVDVIGFHGHTVWHQPDQGETCQIGDGKLLAQRTGIDVVNDLRQADMAAGGQGAPLAPLYHSALAADLEKPLAVLNIGGVANVTWVGEGDDNIFAFDTGPGNALIDDWALETIQQPMDKDGRLAREGTVDQGVLKALLSHTYFNQQPPKSLDRLDFSLTAVEGLQPADGAATLTAFTVQSIAQACTFFPAQPKRWLVCGGGRHNGYLMEALRKALNVSVEPVETVNWSGDALEAQAFGFFAVRSLYGMAITIPGTTGVAEPTTGGVLHKP